MSCRRPVNVLALHPKPFGWIVSTKAITASKSQHPCHRHRGGSESVINGLCRS